MNNPIIYQAGGGLLIISFLVLLFFSARTWRIWHVLFTFAVFGCAIWFCILASMTLKTRITFRKQYEQLKTQLEQRETEVEELLKGKPGDVKDEQPSIRSVRGKIQRELTGRGRVWRSCVPTNLANGAMTLDTPVPSGDPAAGGAAPAGAQNQIVQEDVLYAFLERETPLGKEPWLYLGEFTATAATPTTVTLAPLVPLDEVQSQAVQNWQNQTWALYEVLPVDSHRTYAVNPEFQPNLDLEGESLFGEMNDAKRMELIANSRRLYLNMLNAKLQNATDAEAKTKWEAVIADTQRRFAETDKQFQTDGQVVSPDMWDPEDLWVKVRFLREHTVDVDTATNLDAITTDGYFDIDGRAQIESLQRGERDEDGNFQPAPVEFAIDDVAVFDKETADELIRNDICEQVDTVYVRPTFDFARKFQDHARRMRHLQLDMDVAQQDHANLTETENALMLEIAAYEAEKMKLQDDERSLEAEIKAVTAYRTTITAELKAARDALSLLYRSNRDLAEKLRRAHAEMLSIHRAKQAAEEATASVASR